MLELKKERLTINHFTDLEKNGIRYQDRFCPLSSMRFNFKGSALRRTTRLGQRVLRILLQRGFLGVFPL